MNIINSITNENYIQEQKKRDAFAQKFMKTGKQHGVLRPMTYDKDDFSIRLACPGMATKLNLTNVYAEYKATYGKTRAGVLKQYILGMNDSVKAAELRKAPFSQVRKFLRPLVRSKILTDNEHYEFEGDDPSKFRPTPRQSFSSDANILLGLDANQTVMEVTQTCLDSWGVSFEEALDVAMKNLAEMSPLRFEKGWAGFFKCAWNDYYDSSRLLLPELFSECDQFDEPIVTIPTSGALYIAERANKLAQLEMLNLVQSHLNGSLKIVSTQMYHFVNGKPIEYKPDDEQLLLKLDEINKPLLQSYAAQQKKIVENYLIKNDDWAYIMSLFVSRTNDGGSLATTSVWANDMETIFPEADIIVVSQRTQVDGSWIVNHNPILLWDDVIERYGHLIQKLDGFPNLYRAAPFSAHQTPMAQAL